MKSQLFESISINRQQIDWEICSGIAHGVQKYTKTRTIGREYLWTETRVRVAF
jgi:hypothetical protein